MKRPLFFLCLCFSGIILLAMQFVKLKADDTLPQNRAYFTVYGQIYGIESRNNQTILTLKLINNSRLAYENEQSWDHKNSILCYFEKNADNSYEKLKIGNVVKLKGKVYLFEPATNHGQFDLKKYYSIYSIVYSLKDCQWEDVQIIDSKVFYYHQFLFELREKMSDVITKYAKIEDQEILRAIVLGKKGDLDSDIKDLYKRNGISHILAISGLHITLLGTLLLKLLELIKFPRKLSYVLSICFVISYSMLTGSSASTIRSSIMFSLFLIGKIIKRTYDMLTAMGFSMALLLISNPRYAWHSGFVLSFLAISGIAFVFPVFKYYSLKFFSNSFSKMKLYQEKKTLLFFIKNKILDGMFVSLSVMIASFPIQLQIYYSFPVFSIFLNLIVVPLMSLLLVFGVIGCVVGLLFPTVSITKIIFFPCYIILLIYEKVCQFVDSIHGSYFCIGAPGVLKIFLYYSLLILVLYIMWRLKKKEVTPKERGLLGGVCTAFGICVLLIFVPIRTSTTITMLDVGQGDCFVIRSKTGKTILVDGGSSSIQNVAKYRIEPYLKYYGIKRIDFVFLSHGDEDHVNGILEILQNDNSDKIQIGYLMLTELAKNDEKYDALKTVANIAGTKLKYLRSGEGIQFDNIKITSYTPFIKNTDGSSDSSNDSGQALLIECEEIRTLFLGDLSKDGETKLYEELEKTNNNQKIDILKIAHHGSMYSSDSEFLKKISPEIGLISAGKNNTYGHPHKETLERLDACGLTYFVTKYVGETRVEVDDKRVSVFCDFK